MSNFDKADGLLAAYDLVMELHDEIEAKHCGTPSFLGFATREHHRLIGACRALRRLSKRLADAHSAALKEVSQ